MSIKRRTGEICSSIDFHNANRRPGKKIRTEAEEININSRDDDINYSRSSYKKRKREEDSIDVSSYYCSGRSVIKEDINTISNSFKSLKFYEEDDYATPVVSFPCYVDEGILTEILSRLPVKSLLRFKSVSEYWLNLITQDQHFIHLHSTRLKSRLNILWIAPLPPQRKQMATQRIFSASLSVKTTGGDQGKVIIHDVKQTTDDNWFDYDKVLEPVNGLVCYIHWESAAVRIYNVHTREVSLWIKSTFLAEEKEKFESDDNLLKITSNFHQIYQFGFDPEKKEHKVFCFWRLSASDSATSYASWEALTVGRDTKWRRISVAPNEKNLIKINEVVPPSCPGVHANGTIYWRNKLMRRKQDFFNPERGLKDYDPSDPDVIIAFDVGSEKFRVIPIPSFILDEPREKFSNGPIAMLILGGRITLIYQMSSHIVKLWILDDDGVDKKLENCQGKGSSNWSSETLTLPKHAQHFNFHEFATDADKILIFTYREIDSKFNKIVRLYSYDRKTGILEKIEMHKISSHLCLHHHKSLLTTYSESLFPVQPQQDKNRQSDLVF